MPDTYDVVVAGAGHNSLIAACYLARAGYEVCVLEDRPIVGGDTATEELTVPGFMHDSCSTAHVLIQASPTLRDDELELLSRYGLEYVFPEIAVHVPFLDGTSITQYRDRERTREQLARFSRRDADAYVRMMEDYGEVRGAFGKARYTPIGFGPPLDELLPARWQRINRMSAWDVISHEFEDWHTRGFMLWMAAQTVQPVERPGTGVLAYSLAYGRDQNGWTLPRGGSGALPAACVRLLEEHGATVLTSKLVSGLVLEGGRCTGVETADGERYLARQAVLSSIHVKHLVEMAPADAWGEDFVYAADTWDGGVSMFVTHYATTEPPRFPVEGGHVESVAMGTGLPPERHLRMGHAFTARALDLEDPILLVVCPTVEDPGRAPEGRHTLKVIGFQPYDLADGGPARWDELAEEVSRANLEMLRRYAPNLTDETILGSSIRTPVGLERQNRHNWHGSCHGGALSPAQSGGLRFGHRTPIAGLYQTGSTTHPGGSVSAGPGRNAAQVLLHDLGKELPRAGAV
ncbi:MAG TPA: NAD(P)/FAD-dependent oxidoreductase [Gaiellaceae bacterium]|nr:NAD(P)/FAD-dependent oxidoreductase [Gaiellaceae bacterium]